MRVFNPRLAALLSTLALITLLPSTITARAALNTAEAAPLLKPDDQYTDTTQTVVKLLQKAHYRQIVLDDDFSVQMFDHYLEFLDNSKSHFLTSDIQDFKTWRTKLDETLSAGNLEPAFFIFNRLQERRTQRAHYLIEQLKQDIGKIDFTKNEYLVTDREKEPWLANRQAAETLWQMQFKNDVLGLKLAEKTPDEIKTLLTKRYNSQLTRILQIKSEDVFQLYMDAFTQIYDPHTRYMLPRESKSFDISMSLSLEGIGALLQQEDEYTKVVELVPAGPADKSNLLKPADRITGVAQGATGEMVDIIGWRLDDVVDLIRGPKSTVVRLTLLPANSTDNSTTREIRITRDTVKLEEQAAQKRVFNLQRDGKTFKLGVIKLPAFYIDFKAAQMGDPEYRSSSRDLTKLLRELNAEKIDALIIDLRNNGGGALQEANLLTGLFIKTGPIVQVREHSNQIQILGDRNPGIEYSGPLAVLINRLSASASEIFAGAIQDSGRGIILGSQTFGKGTVQTLASIEPGELKYTQAKFYRISGGSTQHKGIIPDIEFPEIIDKTAIGEDTESTALPWDQILPARYTYNPMLAPVIPELKTLHATRVSKNPDFAALAKRITLLQNVREQNQISMNEAQRKKAKKTIEQQLLSIENERRKAKTEPLLKTFKEYESVELEEGKQKKIDALLTESGEILLDLSQLADKRVAEQSLPTH